MGPQFEWISMLSFPRALAALLSLATAGSTQTQWFVSPGGPQPGFELRQVVQLASPGDTVNVAPGSYMPFTCNSGITIRAQIPGTVSIQFSFLWLTGCTCMCILYQQGAAAVVFNLPANQTAHLIGLSFGGFYLLHLFCGGGTIHQNLVVNGGRATFDACYVDSLNVIDADVHVQDCVVVNTTFGPGIYAQDSNLTITSSTITGHNADNWPASAGIELDNSSLHASGVTVNGGISSPASPGAPGITTTGGNLWLSDADVTSPGGCAIAANGVVRIDRSTLTGGGPGCAVSPTGAPLLGIERGGPITIGQVFQVTLHSEPTAILVVYGSLRLAAPTLAPILDEPIWIDPTVIFTAEVATADPSGQTTFSYPVPAVSALVGAQFWLQGVGGTSLPLQTSPVVGGFVR